jgi:hypothetical protein
VGAASKAFVADLAPMSEPPHPADNAGGRAVEYFASKLPGVSWGEGLDSSVGWLG